MGARLHDLGWDAVMGGLIVVLSTIFLPVLGGLTTPRGDMVPNWWLVAAGHVALFGACLIALGIGLMLLVATGTWLVRRFLAWRHSRVWRHS